MALDANLRQQQMMELTHLQQMDVFSTSRLDTVQTSIIFYNYYMESLLIIIGPSKVI